MIVLGVLPVVVLVLAMLAASASGWRGREAVLVGALGWGAFVAVSTEALSLVGALNARGLTIAWLLAAAVCGIRGRHQLRIPSWRPGMNLVTWCFAAVGGLVSLQLIVALVAAPGTWDSMTYHLPRVEHWRQQGNLDFYPTSIDRQLYSAPWSEFAVAHLRILSGTDRLLNLVQWLSSVLAIVAVTLVTQRLGGDRRAQALSAVATATIPMGILQATSTQTDYTVSLWIVVAVWAVMRDLERPSLTSAVLVGLAVGLAVLTKGTAIVILAPVGLIWLLWRLRSLPLRTFYGIAVIGGLVLVINAGHWSRNMDRFGSPLAPESANAMGLNADHTFAVVASNLIRGGAMNLATTFEPANALVNRAVLSAHYRAGVSVNRPSTTFPNTAFGVGASRNEDTVGNPLHFLLALLSASLLLLSSRVRSSRSTAYVAGLAAACVLFALQLRWQPWITRLELPLFVLAAPMIGLVLARLRAWWAGLAVAALGLPALLLLVNNDNRPLVGPRSVLTSDRSDGYFALRPELRDPYQSAFEAVLRSESERVGLVLGGDDWEYPFWVGLPGRHLESGDAAARAAANVSYPDVDALVCTVPAPECQQRDGWRTTQTGIVTVLLRE